jgi:cytoskeletal protein RodZ
MRRGLSSALRRLLVLPVALSLAVALVVPTTAFAANSTTGYNQTPPSTTGYNQTPPSTTGYNQTPPSAGTSPSEGKSAPTTTTSNVPTTTTTTPAKSAKASTLPFTGFDLRWTVGIGLLLMGMGFLIVMVQRRQRRSTGR